MTAGPDHHKVSGLNNAGSFSYSSVGRKSHAGAGQTGFLPGDCQGESPAFASLAAGLWVLSSTSKAKDIATL